MNLKEIVKATGGRLVGKDTGKPVSGISIDSRTIKRNEAFIAIKGKNFDGHDFIKEALSKGASLIVSKFCVPQAAKQVPAAVVADTVTALGDIAMYHRRKFDIPVIGITGSNGKTTSKEIIAHILSGEHEVLKSRGTENNFIGLPLTLLRLRRTYDTAVIEMGANHLGEIDRLGQILKPGAALITNIGPAHLEFFKDLKTVARAKGEILNHLGEGSLIVNGDDKYLRGIGKKKHRITFGMKKENDFYAEGIVEKNEMLEFNLNGKLPIRLNLAGRHNVYNALAGIAVARIMGMDLGLVQNRLKTLSPVPGRMKVSTIKGIRIIDDTYNSNPLSIECAIRFLSGFKAKGKKIFVSGDMLELGNLSGRFHSEAGRLIARSYIDSLITIGGLSRQTHLSARRSGMKKELLKYCASVDEAASELAGIVKKGDAVLVKGSRAMGMDGIIRYLKKFKI